MLPVLTSRQADKGVNSAHDLYFEGKAHRKEPHEGITPASGSYPLVALEIGVSEPKSDLLEDARKWLDGSDGETKLVILVDIQERRKKIENEDFDWGLSDIWLAKADQNAVTDHVLRRYQEKGIILAGRFYVNVYLCYPGKAGECIVEGTFSLDGWDSWRHFREGAELNLRDLLPSLPAPVHMIPPIDHLRAKMSNTLYPLHVERIKSKLGYMASRIRAMHPSPLESVIDCSSDGFVNGIPTRSEGLWDMKASVIRTSELGRSSGRYCLNSIYSMRELTKRHPDDPVVQELHGTLIPNARTIPLGKLGMSTPFKSLINTMRASNRNGHRSVTHGALLHLAKTYTIIRQSMDNFTKMCEEGFTQDFWSIVVRGSPENIAEFIKVEKSTLEMVKSDIEEMIGHITTADCEVLATVSPESTRFSFWKVLNSLHMLPSRSTSNSCSRGREKNESPPSRPFTIDEVSVFLRSVTLLLDMSLVTYVGDHNTRFDQNQIGRNCSPTRVSTKLPEFPGFQCSLQKPACLDSIFENRPIWVFEPLGSKVDYPALPLQILTYPDVLADVVGTLRSKQDPMLPKHGEKKIIAHTGEVVELGGVRTARACFFKFGSDAFKDRFGKLPDRADLRSSMDDRLLIGPL